MPQLARTADAAKPRAAVAMLLGLCNRAEPPCAALAASYTLARCTMSAKTQAFLLLSGLPTSASVCMLNQKRELIQAAQVCC